MINKPAEFLSVPGVNVKDSAYTRLQALFPNVEGPFVLHRLDMSTSGLLVFALTRRANKSLQKQFITRGIEKRYVALLDGRVTKTMAKSHYLYVAISMIGRGKWCVLNMASRTLLGS